MDITTLTEEEQTAILDPAPVVGPAKEDLIRQIEADYLSAQRDENTELMAELDERHSRVLAASTDQDALSAYEYRDAP